MRALASGAGRSEEPARGPPHWWMNCGKCRNSRGSLAVGRIALLMLAAAGLAQAGYNWYYSDALTSANSAWTQNGSVTYTGTGITSSSGGSLVSTQTAPVFANDYQCKPLSICRATPVAEITA